MISIATHAGQTGASGQFSLDTVPPAPRGVTVRARVERTSAFALEVDVTLAGRVDDYSGFGTTWNPKISVQFRPTEWLMFRGSYNTGFRVPNFNQIFNGVTESPITGASLGDPKLCPGGVVRTGP